MPQVLRQVSCIGGLLQAYNSCVGSTAQKILMTVSSSVSMPNKVHQRPHTDTETETHRHAYISACTRTHAQSVTATPHVKQCVVLQASCFDSRCCKCGPGLCYVPNQALGDILLRYGESSGTVHASMVDRDEEASSTKAEQEACMPCFNKEGKHDKGRGRKRN